MFLRYAPQPEQFHDAHSIYFEVLGEHGFVGLALFLSLGMIALAKGNRIRRISRKRPDIIWAHDLASMIQVSLVGYAVTGLFLGLAYFDLYYHLIAILVITERIVLNEIAVEAADAGISARGLASPVPATPLSKPTSAPSPVET
jgi:probable O-glycosylation ligase (exosortase A-associated)